MLNGKQKLRLVLTPLFHGSERVCVAETERSSSSQAMPCPPVGEVEPVLRITEPEAVLSCWGTLVQLCV